MSSRFLLLVGIIFGVFSGRKREIFAYICDSIRVEKNMSNLCSTLVVRNVGFELVLELTDLQFVLFTTPGDNSKSYCR